LLLGQVAFDIQDKIIAIVDISDPPKPPIHTVTIPQMETIIKEAGEVNSNIKAAETRWNDLKKKINWSRNKISFINGLKEIRCSVAHPTLKTSDAAVNSLNYLLDNNHIQSDIENIRKILIPIHKKLCQENMEHTP
jgi:hypothetical protein